MVPETPLGDGAAAAPCPVCQRLFDPSGGRLYCSKLCRDTAYRRRKQGRSRPVSVPETRLRRSVTVYECDGCGERSLGAQRCDECRTFMRKRGIWGLCPHCDEPITITDLLKGGGGVYGIK